MLLSLVEIDKRVEVGSELTFEELLARFFGVDEFKDVHIRAQGLPQIPSFDMKRIKEAIAYFKENLKADELLGFALAFLMTEGPKREAVEQLVDFFKKVEGEKVEEVVKEIAKSKGTLKLLALEAIEALYKDDEDVKEALLEDIENGFPLGLALLSTTFAGAFILYLGELKKEFSEHGIVKVMPDTVDKLRSKIAVPLATLEILAIKLPDYLNPLGFVIPMLKRGLPKTTPRLPPFLTETNEDYVIIENGTMYILKETAKGIKKEAIVYAVPKKAVRYQLFDGNAIHEVVEITFEARRLGIDVVARIIDGKLVEDSWVRVITKKKPSDAIHFAMAYLFERGLIEYKGFVVEKEGIFWTPSGVFTKIDVEPPKKHEIERALEVIDEWLKFYGDRSIPLLALGWSLASGFSHVIKSLRYKGKAVARPPKFLYLYGQGFTGKSTLAEIAVSIWRDFTERPEELVHPSISSPAQLGEVISARALPQAVNEAESIFDEKKRDAMLPIIKNAYDALTSRVRLIRRGGGEWEKEEIPALSTLVFTSNYTYPHLNELKRRMLTINMERIVKPSTEFERLVGRLKQELGVLGRLAFFAIKKVPDVFAEYDWHEVGTALLLLPYLLTEKEPPEEIFALYWTEEYEIRHFAEEALLNDIEDFVSTLPRAIELMFRKTYANLQRRSVELALEHSAGLNQGADLNELTTEMSKASLYTVLSIVSKAQSGLFVDDTGQIIIQPRKLNYWLRKAGLPWDATPERLFNVLTRLLGEENVELKERARVKVNGRWIHRRNTIVIKSSEAFVELLMKSIEGGAFAEEANNEEREIPERVIELAKKFAEVLKRGESQ